MEHLTAQQSGPQPSSSWLGFHGMLRVTTRAYISFANAASQPLLALRKAEAQATCFTMLCL